MMAGWGKGSGEEEVHFRMVVEVVEYGGENPPGSV